VIAFLGLLAQILYTVCGVPQIIKIYKTKCASGLSLTTWIVMIVAHVSNITYVWQYHDILITGGLIISLTNTILILIGIILYGEKK